MWRLKCGSYALLLTLLCLQTPFSAAIERFKPEELEHSQLGLIYQRYCSLVEVPEVSSKGLCLRLSDWVSVPKPKLPIEAETYLKAEWDTIIRNGREWKLLFNEDFNLKKVLFEGNYKMIDPGLGKWQKFTVDQRGQICYQVVFVSNNSYFPGVLTQADGSKIKVPLYAVLPVVGQLSVKELENPVLKLATEGKLFLGPDFNEEE